MPSTLERYSARPLSPRLSFAHPSSDPPNILRWKNSIVLLQQSIQAFKRLDNPETKKTERAYLITRLSGMEIEQLFLTYCLLK
jgi:hypothetical protein